MAWAIVKKSAVPATDLLQHNLGFFRLVPSPALGWFTWELCRREKQHVLKISYSAQHTGESSFTGSGRDICPKGYEGCFCQGEQLGLRQAHGDRTVTFVLLGQPGSWQRLGLLSGIPIQSSKVLLQVC